MLCVFLRERGARVSVVKCIMTAHPSLIYPTPIYRSNVLLSLIARRAEELTQARRASTRGAEQLSTDDAAQVELIGTELQETSAKEEGEDHTPLNGFASL